MHADGGRRGREEEGVRSRSSGRFNLNLCRVHTFTLTCCNHSMPAHPLSFFGHTRPLCGSGFRSRGGSFQELHPAALYPGGRPRRVGPGVCAASSPPRRPRAARPVGGRRASLAEVLGSRAMLAHVILNHVSWKSLPREGLPRFGLACLMLVRVFFVLHDV